MRALYRALVEVRVLGERLPRKERVPLGWEACWAATALDLRAGDLTSDVASAMLPDYVRRIAARPGTGSPRKAEVLAALSASAKPFAGSAGERLFCAVGAAMALKAAEQQQAALAYVREGELGAADWKRVLQVAGGGNLPLVIVAAGAVEVPPWIRGVPVIPVDASDAVAIYRVAQESLLRARAEGGVAVIECVRTGDDPVEVMAKQLSTKGIATPAWRMGVETKIRSVLAQV